MEEEVKEQSKTTELECNKHIDVTRTLKHSKSDLAKAREDLKEATRARDSVEASLTGAKNRPRNRRGAFLLTRSNWRLLRNRSAI